MTLNCVQNAGSTLRRVKRGNEPEVRRRKKKRTKEWAESIDQDVALLSGTNLAPVTIHT